MFPKNPLTPLKLDHPIYRATAGGKPIELVNYRRYAYTRLSRDVAPIPRLKALELNGEIAAIVSEEDLSAGLVGYSTDGIVGYAPSSATELMRNILLWRAAEITSAPRAHPRPSSSPRPSSGPLR